MLAVVRRTCGPTPGFWAGMRVQATDALQLVDWGEIGNQHGAIAFNVPSLIDVVIAVILGVLVAPGPLQLLQVTPRPE
jgi:hypothetical protein